MKEERRLRYALNRYSEAVERLKEAINEKESSLSIDGTIQRFEFTFELAWKMLQKVLRYQGLDCNSPRDCLRKAYSSGIISDEELWLNMLDDRNITSHIYDEAHAKEIYDRIKGLYAVELKSLKELIPERLFKEER